MKEEEKVEITTEDPVAISLANQQRAITEVQASITIAKTFPRDEEKARQRILNACGRPALAVRSLFSYSRGGSEISGETIRLAEEMARQWGNFDHGWRVLDSRHDASQVEAFAWDKEMNVREARQFWVSHYRVTRQGKYLLTDPRDIYEKQANEAARRKRACILALLPIDIRDEAREECERTMAAKMEVTAESIKKLVDAFSLLGVTAAQIEKRIQRNIESIKPAQVMQLRKIYNSIKDGMSNPESWFEAVETERSKTTGTKRIRDKLSKNKEPESTPVDEPPADVDLPE